MISASGQALDLGEANTVQQRQVNPLVKHIDALEQGSNYLEPQLAERILDILKGCGVDLGVEGVNQADSGAVERELNASLRMLQRMRSQIEDGSGSIDIKIAKDIVSLSNQMANLLHKVHEKVDSNRQVLALEQAILETFDEVENEVIKEQFMHILKGKLQVEA